MAQEKARLLPIQEFRVIVSAKIGAYEAEERRKAEEAQRRLEAEARKIEEERMLQAAVEADAAGNKEEAEAILQEPVATPVLTVKPAFERLAGLSSRTLWSAEVVDILMLARHVIAYPAERNLLQVNQPAINERARSQRDGFLLPGCRLVKGDSMAARTA